MIEPSHFQTEEDWYHDNLVMVRVLCNEINAHFDEELLDPLDLLGALTESSLWLSIDYAETADFMFNELSRKRINGSK